MTKRSGADLSSEPLVGEEMAAVAADFSVPFGPELFDRILSVVFFGCVSEVSLQCQ
jgi:hypothetical protein